MKCQFCSKPKVYDITELEANKAKTTLSLCQDCFAVYVAKNSLEKKENLPVVPKKKFGPVEANQFVQQMIKFVEGMIGQQTDKLKSKNPCPKCNISLQEISKIGKLGCPNCYDWYASELIPILYSSHGSPYSSEELAHVGKKPKNFNPQKKLLQCKAKTKEETDAMRLAKLNYKLTQAVEKEDYETAAKIRDIIADVKKLMKEEKKYEKEN